MDERDMVRELRERERERLCQASFMHSPRAVRRAIELQDRSDGITELTPFRTTRSVEDRLQSCALLHVVCCCAAHRRRGESGGVRACCKQRGRGYELHILHVVRRDQDAVGGEERRLATMRHIGGWSDDVP